MGFKDDFLGVYGWVFIVVVLAFLALAYFGVFDNPQENSLLSESCVRSGGVVSKANCCLSASDFPNTCAIGACGCSIVNSHEVLICECPEGSCFNGLECEEMIL